jgi:hypothetical protein
MLAEFRPADLKLRKRIIIVSDGEDTSSKTSALDVCRSLQKGRIIVDSVQVGTQSDPILHAISVATGTVTVCGFSSIPVDLFPQEAIALRQKHRWRMR